MQRELLFDLGVAYGIDCLLIDPTLGGRCDTFTTFDVSVSPGNTTVERDLGPTNSPCDLAWTLLWRLRGLVPSGHGNQGIRRPQDRAFQIHHQQASIQSCTGLAHSHLSTHPFIPSPLSEQLLGTNSMPCSASHFQTHPSTQSFTYPFNKQFLSLCQNKPCETAMFDRVWLQKWPCHMVLISNICCPYFHSLVHALTLIEPLSWALHCVRHMCISHSFIHAVPFIEYNLWAYCSAQCPSYPYPMIEAVIINSILSIWKLSLKEMKWLKWQSLWPVDFYTRWLIGFDKYLDY